MTKPRVFVPLSSTNKIKDQSIYSFTVLKHIKNTFDTNALKTVVTTDFGNGNIHSKEISTTPYFANVWLPNKTVIVLTKAELEFMLKSVTEENYD